MEHSEVAVATMTWARTPGEEDLLIRSVATLAHLGCPVAVADRGNSRRFTEQLTAIACVNVTVPRNSGLVSQVQASISLALTFSRRLLLYAEPDKKEFFRSGLPRFVDRALALNLPLVLASRSAESFDTYPPTQRDTEATFNRLCGAVLNQPGDYCYGPFLMSRELAASVVQLPTDLGWGWRPAMFHIARQRGCGIGHVVDDYECPDEQRVEYVQDRDHRIRQLSQNLRGLVDPLPSA